MGSQSGGLVHDINAVAEVATEFSCSAGLERLFQETLRQNYGLDNALSISINTGIQCGGFAGVKALDTDQVSESTESIVQILF